MILKTEAIVLKSTPFSDNSVVAKMFTRSFGLQSFLIQGVRSGKGSVRPAHLLPLNLVDVVMYYKPNAGLQRIRELKCDPVLVSMRSSVVKNAIAVFMNELLTQVCTEQQSDEEMFDFIRNGILWLELEDKGLALFPHYFMLHLSRYLGVYPQMLHHSENAQFDLWKGAFLAPNEAGTDVLSAEVSSVLLRLLNADTGNLIGVNPQRELRMELLDGLLRYYGIHQLIQRPLQSHFILQELLHS